MFVHLFSLQIWVRACLFCQYRTWFLIQILIDLLLNFLKTSFGITSKSNFSYFSTNLFQSRFMNCLVKQTYLEIRISQWFVIRIQKKNVIRTQPSLPNFWYTISYFGFPPPPQTKTMKWNSLLGVSSDFWEYQEWLIKLNKHYKMQLKTSNMKSSSPHHRYRGSPFSKALTLRLAKQSTLYFLRSLHIREIFTSL